MALTPEEEKELQVLKEQAELAELQEEFRLHQESTKSEIPAETKSVDAGRQGRLRKTRDLLKEKVDAKRALVGGAIQGATLGTADEVVGGINAALDVAIDAIFRPFTPEEQSKFIEKPEFKKVYKQERDKLRAQFEQLEKDHPGSFLAGELVGGAASSFLPGRLIGAAVTNIAKSTGIASKLTGLAKTATKAKPKLATAGKLAAEGAATGGIAGAGLSKEEEWEGVLTDAVKGTGIGMAVGGVSLLGGALGDSIKKFSNSAQLKGLGVKGKITPKEQEELAKFARDKKILTSSPEQTHVNATLLRERALKGLKDTKATLAAEKIDLINKRSLFPSLIEVFEEVNHKDTKEAAKFVLDIIEEANAVSAGSVEDVLALYSRVGKHTRNFGKDNFSRGAANKIYAIMSENLDEALDAAGRRIKNPDLKNAYRQATSEYRMANKIAEVAKREADKIPEGLKVSSYDMFQATTNPTRAAAQVGGKALLGKFGPTAAAKTQRGIESLKASPKVKAFDTVSQALGKDKKKKASTVGLVDLLRRDDKENK